ncbi:UNVERIFIED_CONTAM: IgLON member 5 [Gekko kuhli]
MLPQRRRRPLVTGGRNRLPTHYQSPPTSTVPARIVNISSAVTVNEGSNVNLLCLAQGKPEPTVTWRQLKDGFTSEGEYLEITEINRQQAGEYECITANGVSLPDRKRVLITVNCKCSPKRLRD